MAVAQSSDQPRAFSDRFISLPSSTYPIHDLFLSHTPPHSSRILIRELSNIISANMASSNSDRDRSPTNDEPTNPFVAFRRFADSQMSALVNNAFGIFKSSPIRRQQAIDDYESMLKESRENRQRLSESQAQSQGAAEGAGRVMDTYLRAVQDSEDETRPARPLDEDDDDAMVEGMRCPYLRPLDQMLWSPSIDWAYLWTSSYSPLALEQQEIFRDHSGKMRAAFADLMAMQEGQKLLFDNTVEKHAQMTPQGWAANIWSMMMFGRDEVWYDWENPRRLGFRGMLSALGRVREQRDKERRERGEPGDDDSEYDDQHEFEEAFIPNSRLCEAIMSAAQDLGMEQAEMEASKEVEGISEDMDGLSDEGGVDNSNGVCTCLHCRNYERRREEFRQWRREELDEELADNDPDERTTNPTSELDQYHALADYQAYLLQHGQQSKARSQDSKSEGAELEKLTKLENKPSILSTLTTTEQRTLPDGTVTTKVVLKKRFSDGGEEVTENVHTQNAPLPQKPAGADTSKSHDPVTSKQKKQQRGGWFWS